MTFVRKYGSGLIGTHAAVRLVETWFTDELFATGTGTAAIFNNEAIATGGQATGATILDDNNDGISEVVAITEAIVVDQVTVHVEITHDHIGDLELILTSPEGASVSLLDTPGTFEGGSSSDIDFVFSITFFRGELSVGSWTLTVIDDAGSDIGTLDSWTMSIYGNTETGNDTVIDLNDSANSTIAGRTLAIKAGTMIEDAITGEDNDILDGGGNPDIVHADGSIHLRASSSPTSRPATSSSDPAVP